MAEQRKRKQASRFGMDYNEQTSQSRKRHLLVLSRSMVTLNNELFKEGKAVER